MPEILTAVVEAYGKILATVEVEVIEPPTKRLLPMYPPPCTESVLDGEVEPIPTKPPWVTRNREPVASPTESVEVARRCWTVVVPAMRAEPCTDRVLLGEVVPMPTDPPVVAKYAEPVEVMTVVDAYGNIEATVEVEVIEPPTNRLEEM